MEKDRILLLFHTCRGKQGRIVMFNVICSKMLRVFKENQKKLFGLSLLYLLMSVLIMILSGAVPILGICIVLVIAAGMKLTFLSAYQKKSVSPEMLFAGFESLKHVSTGMLWMFFNVAVWLLIPVIGIFFAVIKAYEYRFVPYILLTRPEIRPIDALEASANEANGFKKNMFLADVVIIGVIAVAELILYAMSLIPVVGVIFAAAMIITSFIALLCIPFLRGLISASFYSEIYNKNIKPSKHSVICPCCLAKTDGDGMYCSKCGERLVETGKTI